MEAHGAAGNPLLFHLISGDSGQAPSIIDCRAFLTARSESMEKIRTELQKEGIPKQLLDTKEQLTIIQLNCHPGCQKALVAELQSYAGEDYEGQDTILLTVIGIFRDFGRQVKICESVGKVFICTFQLELHVHSEESKTTMFYNSFKLQHDIRASIEMQGTREATPDAPEGLSISFLDVLLQYPEIDQIGTAIGHLLSAMGENFPLLPMLPQIKKMSVKIKANSVANMMKMINFSLSESQQLKLSNSQTELITNEVRVVYLNNVGNLYADVNARIGEMEFILSRYLLKTVSYLDHLL